MVDSHEPEARFHARIGRIYAETEGLIMGGWRKRQGLGWTIVAISGLLMVSTEHDLTGTVIYGFLIAIGIMLALGPSWGQ